MCIRLMHRCLAAVSLLLAASSATAQRYDVTQVVSSSSFAFLPAYVAEQMGYFRDEGVNLKTIVAASAQTAMATVVSGAGSYYLASPVAGARSAAQGAPVVNCGAIMTQNPTAIVLSAAAAKRLKIEDTSKLSDRQRIQLLKGLKLAAHTPGSSPDLTLRFILRSAGLDPERDVEILPITNTSILAALERNRIDGFAYSSPLAENAVIQYGAKRLITLVKGEFPALAGQLSISMVCSRDWIEKSPEAAQAVVRAIWRAMKLMRSDPAQARTAARKAFSTLDAAVFDAAYDANLSAYPESPVITRAQMEAALDFHVKTGGTAFSVDVEKTYTNQIVQQAASSMK